MKILNNVALGMVVFISSAFSQATAGDTDNPAPQPTNYVVIGAFSIHKNAIRFTSAANKQNLEAKYEMNTNRNLYYVYVLSTNDKQQAIEEALRLRKESPYNDTWVYNGLFGQDTDLVKGTDINPETKQDISEVADKSSETIQQVAEAVIVTPVQDPSKTENTPDESVVGKNFYFKIFRTDDKTQIEGNVTVIDSERSKRIGTYAGNKQVRLSNPGNKEGKISLICEVFGFRKVQQDISYQNPEGEIIQLENDAAVVPFELARLQKGDIAVMYNVYFFKDAAIMRPESRYEVTSLLTMLQENPKYKIKIHGHTNGGAHGRIISLNEDNKDFFSLNNTKDGFGSAKKLSEERAEVLRKFLTSNGVDVKRMQIKAWGGKRAIHDKHSPQAQSNVRVEIEILEN
jgi:outer membrane protein OmpA-like peptidoglycan-associated protein